MDSSVSDQFYEGKRSKALPFVINDAVRILSGVNSGKLAAVISIQCLGAELAYLVEHADGSGDSVVKAKDLEHLS
jgi:hypothetical protein